MLSIKPMSGYDVKKLIETSISNFWTESYGQIYPILKALVAEKLVTRKTEKQSGKPDRHVYALAAAGRRVLREWLTRPAVSKAPRNELLLKLFFGEEIPVAASLAHIDDFRQRQRQLLERYAAIEHEIKTKHKANANAPFWLITVAYGRRESEALLRWCDDAAKSLTTATGSPTSRSPGAPRRALNSRSPRKSA
jgi:PadR family transcriptional regulator AphA